MLFLVFGLTFILVTTLNPFETNSLNLKAPAQPVILPIESPSCPVNLTTITSKDTATLKWNLCNETDFYRLNKRVLNGSWQWVKDYEKTRNNALVLRQEEDMEYRIIALIGESLQLNGTENNTILNISNTILIPAKIQEESNTNTTQEQDNSTSPENETSSEQQFTCAISLNSLQQNNSSQYTLKWNLCNETDFYRLNKRVLNGSWQWVKDYEKTRNNTNVSMEDKEIEYRIIAAKGQSLQLNGTENITILNISNTVLIPALIQQEENTTNTTQEQNTTTENPQNETSTSNTTSTQQCSDSDAGINKNIQGTATLGTTSKTDYCSGGGLIEYYCLDNQIKSVYISCEDTCQNGKCITNTTQNITSTEEPEQVQPQPTVKTNTNPSIIDIFSAIIKYFFKV